MHFMMIITDHLKREREKENDNTNKYLHSFNLEKTDSLIRIFFSFFNLFSFMTHSTFAWAADDDQPHEQYKNDDICNHLLHVYSS